MSSKKRARKAAAAPEAVILVDMDDTVADFTGRALGLLAERHPDIAQPDPANTSFPLALDFAPEHKPLLEALYKEPDFFRGMKPIDGAVAALHQMVDAGYDVRLCSSPLGSSPRCLMEKAEWVMEHLGRAWIDRLVLTRDKTLVRGELLIDDAPKAKGSALTPTWEHVYFGRPHNRPGAPGADAKRQRLDGWAAWTPFVRNALQEVREDKEHAAGRSTD